MQCSTVHQKGRIQHCTVQYSTKPIRYVHIQHRCSSDFRLGMHRGQQTWKRCASRYNKQTLEKCHTRAVTALTLKNESAEASHFVGCSGDGTERAKKAAWLRPLALGAIRSHSLATARYQRAPPSLACPPSRSLVSTRMRLQPAQVSHTLAHTSYTQCRPDFIIKRHAGPTAVGTHSVRQIHPPSMVAAGRSSNMSCIPLSMILASCNLSAYTVQ